MRRFFMRRLFVAPAAVIGFVVPVTLLPVVNLAPSATQQALCVLVGTPPPAQGTTTVCP